MKKLIIVGLIVGLGMNLFASEVESDRCYSILEKAYKDSLRVRYSAEDGDRISTQINFNSYSFWVREARLECNENGKLLKIVLKLKKTMAENYNLK